MCPLCRKDIDPTALRCHNCKSWLISGIETIDTSITQEAVALYPFVKGNPGLMEYWQCEWVDQWGTYNEQARTVWTVNICTNSETGATKVRAGHSRRVTDREYKRRFLV